MSVWRDKVVLVTGGSSGLGLAIAGAFASAGANLVLAARGSTALAAAAADLRQHGHEVLTVEADITRQADVDALVQRTIERFGRLDVLVNNAGRSTRGAALEVTPEEFAALMDLNFLGVVRCTRAAAPHLLAAGGHVINIGSLAAKTASKYVGAYPATKFALAAYTQQLRMELAPRGLHVMLVCPGPVARPSDHAPRYADQAAHLPDAAKKPGAGVKVGALDPSRLAQQIVAACLARKPELVRPRAARLLFALLQLSPRWGEWLMSKWY